MKFSITRYFLCNLVRHTLAYVLALMSPHQWIYESICCFFMKRGCFNNDNRNCNNESSKWICVMRIKVMKNFAFNNLTTKISQKTFAFCELNSFFIFHDAVTFNSSGEKWVERISLMPVSSVSLSFARNNSDTHILHKKISSLVYICGTAEYAFMILHFEMKGVRKKFAIVCVCVNVLHMKWFFIVHPSVIELMLYCTRILYIKERRRWRQKKHKQQQQLNREGTNYIFLLHFSRCMLPSYDTLFLHFLTLALSFMLISFIYVHTYNHVYDLMISKDSHFSLCTDARKLF